MKNKKVLAAVIFVIAVALGYFGYKSIYQKNGEPLVPVKVGLSWIHEAQFAGEYYADQYGLYKKEGLAAELIPYDYSDLVEKLISGEYDFTILQGDTLLQARADGKPIVGLFVTYRKSPTVYFTKKESGIRHPLDFVGKKVGVAYSERIPLVNMLKQYDINENSVKIIDREYNYEPLLSGEYDVEAGWITDLDAVEKLGMKDPNVIRASDHNSNIYADIISTTEEKLRENPGLVQKFIRATSRGWEEAAKNPAESALLALKYDPEADSEHLKFVLEASLPLIRISKSAKIGESAFIEWDRMYRILREQGILERDIDIEQAYTNKFLK